MSIIIKGVKMPKEGNYEARLNVNRDGTALLFLYGECGGHAAKEIPPHGRLIDADAYLEILMDKVNECVKKGVEIEAFRSFIEGAEVALVDAMTMLNNMPTIIEAEEKKE